LGSAEAQNAPRVDARNGNKQVVDQRRTVRLIRARMADKRIKQSAHVL